MAGVYQCNQCRHEWRGRGQNRPCACPRCKRYDWAEPKKGIGNASVKDSGSTERGVEVCGPGNQAPAPVRPQKQAVRVGRQRSVAAVKSGPDAELGEHAEAKGVKNVEESTGKTARAQEFTGGSVVVVKPRSSSRSQRNSSAPTSKARQDNERSPMAQVSPKGGQGRIGGSSAACSECGALSGNHFKGCQKR